MTRFLTLLLVPACLACDLTRLPAPASPPSLDAAMAKGQYRLPLTLLKPLLEQHPDDAVVNWRMARTLTALGDLEAALPLAEKAAALDPNSADYHVAIAAIAGLQAQRASLFKQLGFAKRAKKELDLAYSLDPKNIDALYGLMLFDYAAPSMLGGDKAKAQQMAELIVALDPVRGYTAEAELAKEKKDPAAQEALLRKAIGGTPDYTNTEVYGAASLLAELYLDTGRLAQAETLACDAARQEPTRVDAWRVLVAVSVRDQCWGEANDLIALARSHVPNDLSPLYAAAEGMLRLGLHLQTAENLLRQYADAPVEANAPSPAMAHWQLAELLERTGRAGDAVVVLEQAVSEDPALEVARKNLKRLKKTS